MKNSVALVLAGIALLVGVEASADGFNKASTILTKELAEKVMGKPVEGSSSNKEADTINGKTWMSRASYSVKDDALSGGAGVLIRHAESKAQAKSIFESSKSMFKGVAVPGLGDAAYRTEKPAQLNVLKGSTWLIISCGTFRKPETNGQENIAKAILPKIAND